MHLCVTSFRVKFYRAILFPQINSVRLLVTGHVLSGIDTSSNLIQVNVLHTLLSGLLRLGSHGLSLVGEAVEELFNACLVLLKERLED